MAINMPFARGRMSALMIKITAMLADISMVVLFRFNSKIQKTNGMDRCPAIRIVAHAGPSSARRSSKLRLQFLHDLLGDV